jgi:hypothetical protein
LLLEFIGGVEIEYLCIRELVGMRHLLMFSEIGPGVSRITLEVFRKMSFIECIHSCCWSQGIFHKVVVSVLSHSHLAPS